MLNLKNNYPTARFFLVSFFLLPTLLFAQPKKPLSANEILDSSIRFGGGETRIAKIKSSQINYILIQPDKTTAIVNDRLVKGDRYAQCILSKSHSPQTTFYNGEKISRVDGNKITHINDVQGKEEIKLKTYNQLQYAYKKLGYSLDRLPDKKFENFDCFVVNATASNGYTTMNFFDKTNFRLLMVAYPNGNKSAMIEYVFKDSILFNSHIVNTFPGSEDLQILKLVTIELDPSISPVWFHCPYTDSVYIPDHIKTGKFESTNGTKTTFTRAEKSMSYDDDKGNAILTRSLIWSPINADTFMLINDEPSKENKAAPLQILVRVVSWDANGYVCQWITDQNTDTQDYKVVR